LIVHSLMGMLHCHFNRNDLIDCLGGNTYHLTEEDVSAQQALPPEGERDLEDDGSSVLRSLLSFSPDVFNYWLEFLSFNNILRLRLLSVKFREAIGDAPLWKQKCDETFSHLDELPFSGSNWFQMYLCSKVPFLIIGSDPAYLADVKDYILNRGLLNLSVADSFRPLPSFDDFAAVFVFTFKGSVRDPEELGNRLANYVDAGGGVVSALFTFGTYPNGFAGGRWVSEGYSPITSNRETRVASSVDPLLERVIDDHFVFKGLREFNGGTMFFFKNVSTDPESTVVANWMGSPLIASMMDKFKGRVMALSFWPVSSVANPNHWSMGGDILIVNSLIYVSRCFQQL